MNLLDIFKKKESFLLSDTATSKALRNINKEFDDTASKLLRESQELLADLNEQNEKYIEKAKLLKELGFTNSQLVLDMDKLEKDIQNAKSRQGYLDKAKKDYPNYKYIPEQELLRIIDKYKMVVGKVSQYKVYVPDSNLMDIKKFFEEHPGDKYDYFKQYRNVKVASESSWMYESSIRISGRKDWFDKISITKSEHDRIEKEQYNPYPSRYRDSLCTTTITTDKDDRLSDADYQLAVNRYEEKQRNTKFLLHKDIKTLSMCAVPQAFKGDTRNFNGLNEPIVIMETNSYGGKGYIIITAWGDDLPYDPAIYNDKETI